MDQETRGAFVELQQKVDDNSSKIDQNSSRIDQLCQRVDESAAETRRHVDVIAESLRSDMHAVLEVVGARAPETTPDPHLAATVDGLGAAVASTNARVASLETRVDRLEGRVEQGDSPK